MIGNVLVLGAGSAGLIAALTLQMKLPQFRVRVLRSREIGVIGVGEGTTPAFPNHLFQTLGISPALFYKNAQPTWKMGIKFLWGPRGRRWTSCGIPAGPGILRSSPRHLRPRIKRRCWARS